MSDPELTPAQADAVRRALRAARHDAPVPDDVAARLDARLAELVDERSPADSTTTLAPAGATVVAFRRRRWPAVLAAAAAVTAVGLAGTQLLDRTGQGDSLTSAESADDAAGREDAAEHPSAADGVTPELGTRSDAFTPLTALTDADLDRLSDEGYRRVRFVTADTAATLTDRRAEQKSLDRDTSSPELLDGPAAAAVGGSLCGADLPEDLAPAATLYRARHDGDPVILVVLPGPEVSAYPCGGGDPTVVPLD